MKILIQSIRHKLFPQDYGYKIANFREYIANEELLKQVQAKRSTGVTVIPVAIHVMNKGEEIGTGSNISDAQIYSGITAINEHFSKALLTEGDGSGVDTGIRFMLENKYGNGIYRVNGAALSQEFADNGVRASGGSSGISDATMKGWSNLPNEEVCNIWLVPEINDNNGGSGVNGYAYYPTTSIVDGIVCMFNAFGTLGYLKPYTKLNKVPTHEMGHYFALPHTFAGNSCVPDESKYYMSYGAEGYKNTFAQCESDRMDLVMGFARANLSASDACFNLNAISTNIELELISPSYIVAPNSDEYLTVKVTNIGTEVIHQINFEYIVGDLTGQYIWNGAIAPQGEFGSKTITIARIPTDESIHITVIANNVNANTKLESDSVDMLIPTNKPYKVELLRDNIAGQISWAIIDFHTQRIIYSSPKYPNFQAGILDEHDIYLPDGDYVFIGKDVQKGFLSVESYIKLIDNDGNILFNQTEDFSLFSFEFSIKQGVKSADLNNDGVVNILDLSLISKHYGTKIGDELYNEIADLNKDGVINIKDISLWMQNIKPN